MTTNPAPPIKVLLAIDTSPLTDAAVDAVLRQFDPARAEVRLFHAVDWDGQMPTAYYFAEGPAAADDLLALRDRRVGDAETYVERVAARLRTAGFRVTTEVRPEGEIREAILDAAASWRADLLVLATHGRRGLNRILLGSVSEHVAKRAACDVEVVHSPDRATPQPA